MTYKKSAERCESSVSRSGQIQVNQRPKQALYEIRVVTGNKPNSGTDANVSCVLMGRGLQSRDLLLDSRSKVSAAMGNIVQSAYTEGLQVQKFSRNREEVFVLEAEDVGEVHSLIMRHDNTGLGQDPSLYLHRVEVCACVEHPLASCGGRFLHAAFNCTWWR